MVRLNGMGGLENQSVSSADIDDVISWRSICESKCIRILY